MSKKVLQKFSRRLKTLSIEHSFTRLELAEILNISPDFIGMIEEEKEIQRLKMCLKLRVI